MLRKLWKYEYRSTARMMWILVACLCGVIALTGAMVFFSSRFFAARNTLLSEELQGLLGGCTALIALFLFYIITAGSILCSVFLFVRFYQDVATDRAYLYFTTPTTGAQKLSAKLLCGYFWKFLIYLLTAVGLLCIAALGIYGSGVDFSFLRELTAALAYGFSGAPLQAMVFAVVAVLHLLLQPLYQLLVFYFAISLGAVVARRMRLLVSFGFLFALTSVQSFLYQIGYFALFFVIGDGTVKTPQTWITLLATAVCFSLIFHLLLGIIFFVLIRWFLEKKINLI